MALVQIEGVYMNSNLKKSTFDGNEKTSIMIDVYQPESTSNDRAIQIKADDLELLNVFQKEYTMGSKFKCSATVNAYKNNAYYKLVELKK